MRILVILLIYSVTDVCMASFDVPEQVETGLGSKVEEMVSDTSGNAFVIFKRHDGTNCMVLVKRFDVTAGWQQEYELANYADAFCIGEHPRIAMNGTTAIAVWQAKSGDLYDQAWAAVYSGSDWTIEKLADTPGSAPFPQIVMDDAGNALTAWSDNAGIQSKRYVPGSGWQQAEQLATPATLKFQLKMNAIGNAMLTWLDGSAGGAMGPEISAKYYNSTNGEWGDKQIVAPANTASSNMALALNNANEALAVWSKTVSGDEQVNFNWFAVGQGWGTAQQIVSGISGNSIVLELNNNGDAVVAWKQDEGGARHTVYGGSYSKGGAWSYEAISTESTISSLSMGLDSTGNAIVIWQEFNALPSTNSKVVYNQFSSGVGWSGSQQLNTGNLFANFPQVTVNTNGDALAVWGQGTDSMGSNVGVWSATGDTNSTPNTPDNSSGGGGSSSGDGGGGLFGVIECLFLLLLSGVLVRVGRRGHVRL